MPTPRNIYRTFDPFSDENCCTICGQRTQAEDLNEECVCGNCADDFFDIFDHDDDLD